MNTNDELEKMAETCKDALYDTWLQGSGFKADEVRLILPFLQRVRDEERAAWGNALKIYGSAEPADGRTLLDALESRIAELEAAQKAVVERLKRVADVNCDCMEGADLPEFKKHEAIMFVAINVLKTAGNLLQSNNRCNKGEPMNTPHNTTAQRLAEIRDRESKATKGPWFISHRHWNDSLAATEAILKFPFIGRSGESLESLGWLVMGKDFHHSSNRSADGTNITDLPRVANEDFIAHSRADIPWLLDRVAELEAKLKETEKSYQTVKDWAHRLESKLETIVNEFDRHADGAPDATPLGHFCNAMIGLCTEISLGEVSTLRETLADEKARRAYYQDLVYAACNAIDELDGKKPGGGIVCGTVKTPSTEFQDAVNRISTELSALRRQVEEARDALKGIFDIIKDEKRMQKQYPAGTCNAEDAWSEFSKQENEAWKRARTALQQLATEEKKG